MNLDTFNARLGSDGWVNALAACGIEQRFLKNKKGPCPACGGKDRFRFDNKGTGQFICNKCGAGYGIHLVMLIFGIPFEDAFQRVLDASGIRTDEEMPALPRREIPKETPKRAEPTSRVWALLRETCAIENCEPARYYLESRGLWPLPEGHRLRAHPSVEYWNEGATVGRFPALIARVVDAEDTTVTAHVTYLTHMGEKLSEYEPRKILSPLSGRIGCASRLVQAGETLGIAEGIETAMSAMKLTGIPTWAALNSALLGKFDVGPSVKKLVIFSDRDIAGMEATTRLMQKLQGKVHLDFKMPKGKDFNDDLRAQHD